MLRSGLAAIPLNDCLRFAASLKGARGGSKPNSGRDPKGIWCGSNENKVAGRFVAGVAFGRSCISPGSGGKDLSLFEMIDAGRLPVNWAEKGRANSVGPDREDPFCCASDAKCAVWVLLFSSTGVESISYSGSGRPPDFRSFARSLSDVDKRIDVGEGTILDGAVGGDMPSICFGEFIDRSDGLEEVLPLAARCSEDRRCSTKYDNGGGGAKGKSSATDTFSEISMVFRALFDDDRSLEALPVTIFQNLDSAFFLLRGLLCIGKVSLDSFSSVTGLDEAQIWLCRTRGDWLGRGE